tara:strand:+ start:518 stop:1324 length:807 start_codon:yes stop_codon:yes gene_type:complete
MNNLEIYCVTDKRIKQLENTNYNLAAVGKNNLPNNYLKCNSGDHIFYKEEYYSELTFHYWYWKNRLDIKSDKWIGFCQKRRFWIDKSFMNKNINHLNYTSVILKKSQPEWQNYESIICNPIYVNKLKKMTILKKGFINLIKKPSILFNIKNQNIALHFDLHHGNGNLDKAISVLNKSDQVEFFDYVNTKTYYNPHIMFIAKPIILDRWFQTLFPWLERCEKIFGFKNLEGYRTQRLYAYLAERYLSFWFKKYTASLEWPWIAIKHYEK